MSRVAVVTIGIVAVLAIQHVPAPDTLSSFALGGFTGLVLGAVLGAAFVVGERETP
jgi:hypothetical protein